MELLSAFIGAIIGGVFSLVTTLIIVKKEIKLEYEQWLRNQKIQSYIDLSTALSKLDVSIIYNENDEKVVLNSKAYKDNSRTLYIYTEEHAGEFELFLPNEIKTRIIKLKALLYKIVSSDDGFEFDVNSLKNKSGIAYELIEVKQEIIHMLQNDLKTYSKKKNKKR